MRNAQAGKPVNHIAVGLCLGVAMGCALGVAMGNLAYGIGPGIALGVGVGAVLQKRNAARTAGEDQESSSGGT